MKSCSQPCKNRTTLNRHRGEPRGSSPATPPDKRVRIRRFGWIELWSREQPWKS